MSKIDDLAIRRIIETANIVDVVGAFIPLKQKGPRYLGLCPFHEDHNIGSFIVYPRGNCYRCFACEAKGDSIKFLQEHCNMDFIGAIRWLGQHYGIPVDDVPVDYTPPVKKEPEPLPMLTLPIDIVLRRRNLEHDTFALWLYSLPWNGVQRDRIRKTLDEYLVGHSTIKQNGQQHDFTIFWQIDDKQRVRTGKMMKYRCDGHRMKKGDTPWTQDWVHAILFRDENLTQFDPDKMEMRQCLFGQHLLNAWQNATINIVESEKTALIMDIAYGNRYENIWMACGGLSNISRDKLKPLMDLGRRIQLFPDKDGIKAWREKATELKYDKLGFNTEFIDTYWKPEDGPKADVADVVLRMIRDNNT
ncbi:MAG: hypothetical protein J6V61_01880 [Bacteroidaceae bacterium]|nr:hypothetical protein [Bacteroidaceae bacterium]